MKNQEPVVRIQATVVMDLGTKTYTEDYDESKSVEEYCTYFIAETRKNNLTNIATVVRLRILETLDGMPYQDEEGNIADWEVIYAQPLGMEGE